MTKALLRRLTLTGALALACSATLCAQEVTPDTPLQRQLHHVDLGIQAAGSFTTNTSGTTPTGQTVFLAPTSTIGYLVSLRYIHSPFIGFEFNYERARYDEDYTYTNATPGSTSQAFLSVQNNVTEYSFGYVVNTPHTYYGVQPFASAGAGSIAFRPTNGGGQGNTNQARAGYYYHVGLQAPVYGEHLGFRLGFRQAFALAPDFQQTYLRDHQHAVSTEPTLGIYIKF